MRQRFRGNNLSLTVRLRRSFRPPLVAASYPSIRLPRVRAYSIEEQLGWDELPPELAKAMLSGV